MYECQLKFIVISMMDVKKAPLIGCRLHWTNILHLEGASHNVFGDIHPLHKVAAFPSVKHTKHFNFRLISIVLHISLHLLIGRIHRANIASTSTDHWGTYIRCFFRRVCRAWTRHEASDGIKGRIAS